MGFGQCFVGQDVGNGNGGVGFVGKQYVGVMFFYVVDEVVVGVVGNDDVYVVEWVWVVVVEGVQDLIFGQIDLGWCGE